METQTTLTLTFLRKEMIPAAIMLDKKTLGGMWTEQGYQTEIERDKSICLALTTSSDQLIGMGVTWVVMDEAHITLITVDPEWQCVGLGSILLNRLLQLATVQKDCARATLEVESSNQSALHLYHKFQFQALGTRPHYYGQGTDAIILWQNQLQSDDYQSFLVQTFRNSQIRLQQTRILLNNLES